MNLARIRARRRRWFLALAAAFPATIAIAQDAKAPQEETSQRHRDDDSSTSWEYTRQQEEAIKRGLRALAHTQSPTGNWSMFNERYDVALTSLAGLAFLGAGHQPGRGPHIDDQPDNQTYGEVVVKAARWLIKIQWPDNHPSGAGGLFYDHPVADNERIDRPMHGHGYALLFLAEVYGQASDPAFRQQIHDALVRGVHLTERTQSAEGGWFYKPNDIGRDEGSVTITQIQGLRAARNAGIAVSRTTIDRAVEYIRRSQIRTGEATGGVRYTIHHGDPSPALTAAGIAVYYGAGEYGSPGIEMGFKYLSRNMRMDDKSHWWFYTHFYAVQAMHQRGLPEWKEYYVRLRQQLLGGQNGRGEWDDPIGPVFGTAIACLCLEVPLRYLPIFQR